MIENSQIVGAGGGAAASVVTLVALIIFYRLRKRMAPVTLGETLVSFVAYAIFGGFAGWIVGWLDWPFIASCIMGVAAALGTMQLSKWLGRP